MRNPDDEDPLDPLDLFLDPKTISPLSVGFDVVAINEGSWGG